MTATPSNDELKAQLDRIEEKVDYMLQAVTATVEGLKGHPMLKMLGL